VSVKVDSRRAKVDGGEPRVAADSQGVSAEAALSFLKDTKGAVSWGIGEMLAVLKIGRREAEQVLALLEAQGYVARDGNSQWLTTAAGESVAGAKMPRFSGESVEQAIEELKIRIAKVNKDRNAAFRVASAAAFGDFLLKGRAKVQAADVGVKLVSHGQAAEMRSAADAKQERAFLKQLRGKAPTVNVRPYAEWMGKRWHWDLV
jgi:hypothetical protein